MKTFRALLVFCGFLVACQGEKSGTNGSDEILRAQAVELAQKYILADTHVDLPYRLQIKHFRLEREYMGIPISTTEGDFDFERARKGGLDAPFMSIYIPSEYQLKPDKGKLLADSLIKMIEGIVEAHPDKFALAGSPAEIQANSKEGKISLPLGMENGAPVGNSLENIKYFYSTGYPVYYAHSWKG